MYRAMILLVLNASVIYVPPFAGVNRETRVS